jgi:hypothetical protein
VKAFVSTIGQPPHIKGRPMQVKITADFSALQRQMKDINAFGQALELIQPKADLLDPASVQAALSGIDRQIDKEAKRYPGNKIIAGLAAKAKEAMRSGVEEQARKAQGGSMGDDICDVAGYPDEPQARGRDAYNAGREEIANPYPEDKPEHHEWLTGWHAAAALEKD